MQPAEGPISDASEARAADGLARIEQLGTWLAHLLGTADRVEVLSRKDNEFTSTYPSEIVECRIAGSTVELLIKWCSARDADSDRRSGGALYEIHVYRHVLADVPLSLPPLRATWIDEAGVEGCLVLDYLRSARRLLHARGQVAVMEAAARWIGEFHGFMRQRLDAPGAAFLRRLDARAYAEVLRRIVDVVSRQEQCPPWLNRLVGPFEDLVAAAFASDLTVLHGEYYPKNVLVHAGSIVPVDWETAAVGPGALDMAMLIDGWDDGVVEPCLRAYHESRYGSFDPVRARRWLAIGAVLTNLQWLGRAAGRDAAADTLAGSRRMEKLRRSAAVLGVA